MTNKERIVELLNNYISENKALKEEYKDLEIKISLFNEVLKPTTYSYSFFSFLFTIEMWYPSTKDKGIIVLILFKIFPVKNEQIKK